MIKTTGLDPILLKIQKIRTADKLYIAKLGSRATTGTLTKPSEADRRVRVRATETRTAGQNVIILRFHARGGAIARRDSEGQALTTDRGKAKWKNIYVGVGANRRLAKRVLVRAGKKLKKVRTVAQQVPPRNIQFFTAEEYAKANAIWRDGAVSTLSGNGDLHGEMMKRCLAVGEVMREAYRTHIDRSMGADGPLKPCLDGTNNSKMRQTGKIGPPLYRTGQLYNSFIVTAESRGK